MTVPVPSQLVYSDSGDGVTTTFSFPVRFLDKAEVVVLLRDVATGVDTKQVLGSDYTIAGSSWPTGGNIVFNTAPPVGTEVIRYRETVAKQVVDLANTQRNDAEAVETQLDRLAMVQQDQKQELARALKADIGESGLTVESVPEGHFWLAGPDGRMIDGGSAADIAAAQGYAVEAKEARDEAQSAQQAAEGAADRAQSYAAMLSADKVKFPTVAGLLADEVMSYTAGDGLIEVGPGDIIEAQGYRYEIAADDAVDHHLETTGGVKLYFTGKGLTYEQIGVVEGSGADGVANAAAIERALAYLESIGGGAIWVYPGTYVIGDRTEPATCIRARSNVTFYHMQGVTYLRRANGRVSTDPESAPYALQNTLLQIDGKEFGPVNNFHWLGKPLIDGEGQSGRCWNAFGEFNNVTIEMKAKNTRSFMGVVADADDYRFTMFDTFRLSCDYSGTLMENAYALINVFPKKEVDGRPASKRLIFYDCDMDATAGNTSSDLGHATNCIKISNVDGVFTQGNVRLRGGRVSAFNLTNCSKNFNLDLDLGSTFVGLQLNDGYNILTLDSTGYGQARVNFTGTIGNNISNAVVIQGALPGIVVDVASEDGGVLLKANDYVRFAYSSGSGTLARDDTLTTSSGVSAKIAGWSSTHIVLARGGMTGGTTVSSGDTFTTSSGASGTIGKVDDPDAMYGAIIRGYCRRGYFRVEDPGFPCSPIKGLKVDLVIDGALSNTVSASNTGNANWRIDDSDISLHFINPPIYCLTNYGHRNRLRIFSDGVGENNSASCLLRDYGKDTTAELVLSPGNTRHTYMFRGESGSSGLEVRSLKGPSSIKVWAGTASHPITRGNRVYMAEFDLSAAAATKVLALLDKPAFITGVQIIYPDGTTADAGVSLQIGMMDPSGPDDDDAYFKVTSATSKGVGDSDSYGRISGTTGASANLIEAPVPAGVVLTATCAGGKTGADRAVMIVHVAELFAS